jgi:hypothetical protein
MMKIPRNTPRQPHTHPIEREQEIRRIRRHRLLGEVSASTASFSTGFPAGLVGALRECCQTLERDRDSYDAWVSLSRLFEELDDTARSRMCRGVAFRLRDQAPARAILNQN